MKCVYNGVTDEKFLEGVENLENNGGHVYTNGTFEVKGVEGRYSHDGEELTIVVDDKPWLASWDMIESKLDDFFMYGLL
jgi:hypothetical protein